MKKLLLLCLCLILALSALSCSNSTASVSGGYVLVGEEQVVPEYVMELNGEKIGFDEYRYFFLNLVSSLPESEGKQNDAAFWTEEKIAQLKTTAQDYIVKAKALNAYAKDHGLQLTETEKAGVEDYVDSIIENLGQEQFNELLKTLSLTEALYRRLQAEEKTYEKVYNHLFQEGGELAWTQEEFLKYYNETYLCTTHILIEYLPGETADNCPQTMEEAQRIHGLCATEDFSSLIKQYGKDANLEKNPTGYYFKDGDTSDYTKILYPIAKTLEVNAYSRPVVSEKGIHIIKRLEPNAEQVNLQKEAILWGSSAADGSSSLGVYATEFENFYNNLAQSYTKTLTYNPKIEAYLKPGLVF